MTLASKAAQAMTKEQLEQSIYARTRRFVDDDVLDAVLDLLAAAREVATVPEGWIKSNIDGLLEDADRLSKYPGKAAATLFDLARVLRAMLAAAPAATDNGGGHD